MKKLVLLAVVLGVTSGVVSAKIKPAEIKLRDVDFKGMMGVESSLTLVATFDVRKESLFDEMVLDFYMLLEPDDEEQGLLFFHCRTVHRFLEEGPGYTSGVALPASIMKCIDPSDGEYAVVVTCEGKEVAVENSLKKRWWENDELGAPIENVLIRSGSAPIIREWETK